LAPANSISAKHSLTSPEPQAVKKYTPFPRQKLLVRQNKNIYSDGHHLAVIILYSGGMHMQQNKSQFKRLMKLVELIRDPKHPGNGLFLSADGDYFESQGLTCIKPFIAQYRQ
jgi:hypothetical protein